MLESWGDCQVTMMARFIVLGSCKGNRNGGEPCLICGESLLGPRRRAVTVPGYDRERMPSLTVRLDWKLKNTCVTGLQRWLSG